MGLILIIAITWFVCHILFLGLAVSVDHLNKENIRKKILQFPFYLLLYIDGLIGFLFMFIPLIYGAWILIFGMK